MAAATVRELVARALDVVEAGAQHDELEIVAMLLRDALEVLDEQAAAQGGRSH